MARSISKSTIPPELLPPVLQAADATRPPRRSDETAAEVAGEASGRGQPAVTVSGTFVGRLPIG